ncbi:hypothetical protein Ccrd_014020, partial [Cynara cardunculus var. scolymus]
MQIGGLTPANARIEEGRIHNPSPQIKPEATAGTIRKNVRGATTHPMAVPIAWLTSIDLGEVRRKSRPLILSNHIQQVQPQHHFAFRTLQQAQKEQPSRNYMPYSCLLNQHHRHYKSPKMVQ